jgi:hypothetical protein
VSNLAPGRSRTEEWAKSQQMIERLFPEFLFWR